MIPDRRLEGNVNIEYGRKLSRNPRLVWIKSQWKSMQKLKIPPKTSRFLSFFFVFMCTIGFVFQVQTISVVYFQYATATDILISLPDKIEIPDFSFCVRYTDVLDVKAFDPSAPDPNEKPTSMNDEEIRALQMKVTIADIFKFTPNISELWIRCLSRKVHDYNVLNTNSSECNQVFSIRKFYVQEYICYSFHQLKSENATYEFRNIAFSLAFPGVFYGLIFENNGSLARAEYCRAVVHAVNVLPTDSLSLSPGFYRKWEEKKKGAKYNNFQVGYYQLFKKLLPFPFQTNCRDYDLEGLSNQNDCVNNSFPIPLQHINTGDLANDTFTDLLKEAESKCFESCDQMDCDDSYTLSQIMKEEKANGGDGLSFMINAPRQPSFTVTHRPLMPITDYLVYVLSCFGTWFGLSVLSLNPFSWKGEKRTETYEKKFCCFNTKAELRREMRNDFIQLSRLVAQLKWGNKEGCCNIPPKNPGVRSRFRVYANYHPNGEATKFI